MERLTSEAISKRFEGVAALGGVSLEVRRGEILGLIGPNGSGKTTLLNVLTGVFPPTSGRVYLNGRDITGWPSHRVARQGVGRTFQSIRLFRDLSVLENVEVAAVAAGLSRADARRRAGDILREVDLVGVAGAPAGSLPHGDQRRLEIARALGVRPVFLLLDEPAAGLNQAEGDELLATIARIRDQTGCGILVVDHDMRLIMRVCERIHVLDGGMTLFEGTPREVRESPAVAQAYLGERRVRGA